MCPPRLDLKVYPYLLPCANGVDVGYDKETGAEGIRNASPLMLFNRTPPPGSVRVLLSERPHPE
jgi:hypothetical protein